ncbi:MAG: pyruvate kinase [Clostridia bacterium]|nr:pyruvate kinase [Clostridia bacterium]
MRSTKIVCTLGPACATQEKMEEMLRAGMNVARMNFSHGDHAMHLENLTNFRRAREAVGVPAALLLDTRGPEIRTLPMEGEIPAVAGEEIILSPEPIEGAANVVAVTYPRLAACLRPGNRVLIDDGKIALRVERIEGVCVHTVVENGGAIHGYKGINLPGVAVDLPFLSEKDKADLRFAAENDVDYIAASFTRTAQDLRQMRAYLDVIGAEDIRIIAKIENRQGIANFDEILEEADGIMVARGDMGVEIDYERLPGLQKTMITRCRLAGKPTITATQMLDSMIVNPTPTRAEVSDVANAVFDGTSAVMLSAETAAGKYPVESIKVMAKIVARAEQDMPEGLLDTVRDRSNVSVALCDAACTTARDLGAVALLAVTRGGVTARDMSALRPRIPILALTPEEKTYQQLALSHGVVPLRTQMQNDSDKLFGHVMQVVRESGYVKSGDRVVITAGLPIGESGSTNVVKVQTVE